jgi:hypothetical protein
MLDIFGGHIKYVIGKPLCGFHADSGQPRELLGC